MTLSLGLLGATADSASPKVRYRYLKECGSYTLLIQVVFLVIY